MGNRAEDARRPRAQNADTAFSLAQSLNAGQTPVLKGHDF